jgi:hypothetical protein
MPRARRTFAQRSLRRRLPALSLLLAAALSPARALPAPAARASAATTTWQVSPGSAGACTQADPNCHTIQSAVDAASSGDTIRVAAGTYAEHVTINKDLTVNGAGAPLTVVDGTQTGRVFTINSGAVSLSGMTVSNGHSPDVSNFTGVSRGVDGGGIFNQGTLTLTNVTVSGNQAGGGTDGSISTDGSGGHGGGILNHGTLTLTDSAISGNHAGDGSADATGGSGGGIYNDGTLNLTDSTVGGNRAGSGGLGGRGGGIFNTGTLTLTNAAISGNVSGGGRDGRGGDGGGILNGNELTIINSTIIGNFSGGGHFGDAGSGGGIYNTGATSLTNSSVSENQSGKGSAGGRGGHGGGIYNAGALTLAASAASNNHAGDSVSVGDPGNGGGIYNISTLKMTSSTISGNTAGSSGFGGGLGGGIYSSGGVNINSSTVSGNLSGAGGPAIGGGHGGGIYNTGTLTLTNATISDNRTGVSVNGGHAGYGGGIYSGGSLIIIYSTIAANFTGGTNGSGGGVFGSLTARNTIIAGNSDSGGGGPDVQGFFNSEGNNLIQNVSGATINEIQFPGTDITGQDARLGPLSFYGGPTQTHILLCGSPAIDNGNSTYAPPTDQRGVPRPAGAAADIGAVEMQKAHINSNDSGAGSLRQLIRDAPDGAVIDIEPCAAVAVTLTSGELLIDKSLTLNGPGAGLLTVQRSAAQDTPEFRIFEIAAGKTVNLFGMTISNGKATNFDNGILYGGGIYNAGGTVNVSDSIISGNSIFFGGGIFNIHGTMSITNCAVSGNQSLAGGGGNGGGIYNLGTMSIKNSTVSNNFSSAFAGGIANYGTMTVIGSTVNGNSASRGDGGGILNSDIATTMSVTDSTISGNSGDGIFDNNDGTMNVTNCTISGNSGYGIRNFGGVVKVGNNIIAGNTGLFQPDLLGQSFDLGHNLVGKATIDCCSNGVNGDIVGTVSAPVDAKLLPLGDYGGPTRTQPPRPSSPAIDAGDDTVMNPPLSLLTDQRGFSRKVGAHVDIGAVEFDPSADTIDNPQFFVRQHYNDFLGRSPDASGLQFWTNSITSCGADANCVAVKRVDTSAAFFLSIEFQNTSYFVYRIYKSAFGDINPPFVPVPVRFADFLRDKQAVSQGVVVGQGDWQQQLATNKAAFALAFVQRPDFLARYPALTSATDFVNSLNANAGGVLNDTERSALINELSPNPSDASLRADVLQKMAENVVLQQREFDRAFVLMEYFGYLQRDPDSTPDADFSGYHFWLQKLDSFGGDYRKAEMVKAFINSDEYRRRFGP